MDLAIIKIGCIFPDSLIGVVYLDEIKDYTFSDLVETLLYIKSEPFHSYELRVRDRIANLYESERNLLGFGVYYFPKNKKCNAVNLSDKVKDYPDLLYELSNPSIREQIPEGSRVLEGRIVLTGASRG